MSVEATFWPKSPLYIANYLEFLWLYFATPRQSPVHVLLPETRTPLGSLLNASGNIEFHSTVPKFASLRHQKRNPRSYYFIQSTVIMSSGSNQAVYGGYSVSPEVQHNQDSQSSSTKPPNDPSLRDYRLSKFVNGPNSTPVPSDHTPQEVEDSHRSSTSETLSAIEANLP
ncbi:hypothetical protein F4809DRAFT_411153 [Biscogniauxia mediterranea]|nr:hypothetical protein F4809DRAFT_411153 [Biscogniauxia mediterranea]